MLTTAEVLDLSTSELFDAIMEEKVDQDDFYKWLAERVAAAAGETLR